uniref:Glutamine amidotransferase-like class 1 domain-containing protein 1 n=1 Tax=Phallusia mammillata TaxID=59560 RepID=A0A6F9DMQ7_9ASCI|nr:Parkinson disease 7 domain-containing protein 1 [Phallusia mammillata]
MGDRKPSCLVICSSHKEGVCAQSFIHAFTLTNSAFTLSIATPQGIPVDFVNVDDNSRRWVSEFRTKSYASPMKLESVEASQYNALLIPNSPGALYDLVKHDSVKHILRAFTNDKKPICAVGFGTVVLAAGKLENNEWCCKGYSLTGPSVYELIQRKDFSTLPIIFEDFAKDNFASYTASEPGAVHVVVDRHLITGQNSQSTLTAVQNLILATNAR